MKKWIVLLLCAAMALSMAACGSKDSGTETTNPTDDGAYVETRGPEQTEESQTPEETEDPGYDGSWADGYDNEAAAQISDPALRDWVDYTIETVAEDEQNAVFVNINAYPAGDEMDASTRYSICIAVREEAEAYADEMRYCGFTLNEVVTEGSEVQIDKETWIPGDYTFEADNAQGYHCTIQVVSGEAVMKVSIEKIVEDAQPAE